MQKTPDPINTDNTAHCRESLFTRDCMPAWNLWLSITAQHPESIILHIANPEKDQNSTFEVPFLVNVQCIHNPTVVSGDLLYSFSYIPPPEYTQIKVSPNFTFFFSL